MGADITVKELRERLTGGESIVVIDVREPFEYEAANIGAKLIPLGELPQRIAELSDLKEQEIVIHCRSGHRSASAVQFLTQNGFVNARNLKGGILAWKQEVDSSLNVN